MRASLSHHQLRLIRLFLSAALLLTAVATAAAQAYPSKIRGYKVYNADVRVRSADPASKGSGNDAELHLTPLRVIDIGITGITVAAGGTIYGNEHSGKIHFLTFENFRINGIPIEIDEYTTQFSFSKGAAVDLPVPAHIFINTISLAKAVKSELFDRKDRWHIDGTVFVFGKFKRFGIGFKRVVPVRIDIEIDNPLR